MPHSQDTTRYPGSLYGFDDETKRSLTWSTPSGEMGASPAHQRAFGGVEKIGARDELRSLREALELPGSLSDYHFAIQRAAEAAYKGRRKEPALIGEAKRLWWLDVDLVETHPSTVRHLQGEICRVDACERLVRLYEGEGYLTEALKIAERGLASGQLHLSPTVERLRGNLAELEAEEAGA